jgi:ABC-type spermidine/putrescine transport system permease subunit II
MTTRLKRWILSLIIALPVAVIITWLASGREVFTKHTKWVQVSARDPLFGDIITQSREVHGPIAGYYVGLDLVVLSVLIAVIAAIVLWWVNRRQVAKQGTTHESGANEP